MHEGFLRTVTFRDENDPNWDNYPFSLPAVRDLDGLEFDPKVTFFVGENGSGKSTIIEALAAVLGMNPEGAAKWCQPPCKPRDKLHMELKREDWMRHRPKRQRS